MKFRQNITQYLSGGKFSNGLSITIGNNKESLINRNELIIEKITNKKVIHLGCCDHIPLISKKIENGIWLHKLITNRAERCVGVDINKDAVDYVRSKYNYKNILYADITASELIKEIKNDEYDLMVMGEILEHINEPIDFLTKIRSNYQKNIKQILITVPNAFSLGNFINAKRDVEIINSDHRYWFTPYTLAKVATEAGYKVSEFFFTDEINKKTGTRAKVFIFPFINRKIKYNILQNHPALRANLIMIIDV